MIGEALCQYARRRKWLPASEEGGMNKSCREWFLRQMEAAILAHQMPLAGAVHHITENEWSAIS
jgi:hypothetical protein